MRTRAWLILAVLLCAQARTGHCANKTGTGSAAFLKLPADARAAALGETCAARPGGPLSLFQNPADMAAGKGAVAFSHAMLPEGVSYDAVAAGYPLAGGVISAGAQSVSYGSFASLDNTGAPAGSLSPRDGAYALGYAARITDGMLAGGSAKYISSKISGSASSAALDLGLSLFADDFYVGAALQNQGKGLKFNKEESPLPNNLKLGVLIPHKNWNYSVDLNFPKDGPAWAGGGAEYNFEPGGAWTLAARAGYSSSAMDAGTLSGLSAGFGLYFGNFTLDYAIRTQGLLGSTHHFGLAYYFHGSREK